MDIKDIQGDITSQKEKIIHLSSKLEDMVDISNLRDAINILEIKYGELEFQSAQILKE